MPAQRAMFVEYVIGKPGSNLVYSAQYLCNRTSRHRDLLVLESREEPVKVRSHFNYRHGDYPNRTEYTGG